MTEEIIRYPQPAMYIAGEWTSGNGTETLGVLNPATGEVLGEVPLGAEQDIAAALEAACAAQDTWRATSPTERADILRSAAAILRRDVDDVARLTTLELGKPLRESLMEVSIAAEHLEWAAEEARRGYGRIIPARAPGVMQASRREPLGPIAGFAPWNAPLITPARKIAYVLAAGCTLVLKPSEETPACAVLLARALEEAGLPPGVLNIVFGEPTRISARLLGDPRIKGVTFTGSTAVGRILAGLAAPSMKRLTLELGGHAPVIVTADADILAVARSAVVATYRNSGQICVSPSRFFVHESVHGEFVDAFTKAASSLVVGNGLDERTQMGPVANESRIQAMDGFIRDARERGLDIPVGGERIDGPGTFWAPTLIVDAGDESLIANEEPFGPLAATFPFATLDEAISRANRLPVGLASYVWTDSLADAARCMDEINAGSVVVNRWQASIPETPFGGYDDSGIGIEGGVEGIAAFQRTKYTAHG
ncbi:NAD-dependent succinate-semialdehyde dehydrogenase [Streptomyces sp. NPDC032161]|uniref:NAD-dependent succinate-semialdehyde dehydrogenase n=1 Tax=unclassified Streptomyces TaxID=2593676 RepID=UPI0033CC314F